MRGTSRQWEVGALHLSLGGGRRLSGGRGGYSGRIWGIINHDAYDLRTVLFPKGLCLNQCGNFALRRFVFYCILWIECGEPV